MSRKQLTFFVTINKLNDELALQEGGLLSLKIPKQWQKPDPNIKNPALWVCHLPDNSLGIVYISLYPTELIIGEKMENYSEEELKKYGYEENSQLIYLYKGTLEPNGENDKERFYRCRLKLQEKKEEETKSSDSGAGVIVFLIIVFVIIGVIAASGGFN